MAIAKELTAYSWLLETNTGDKLGLVSHNISTGQYLLIGEDISVNFGSWQELGSMLGDSVSVEERKQSAVTYNTVEGWPIAHDTAVDVVSEVDGRITYRASERLQTKFYAGYWVITNTERDKYKARLSLSHDIYLSELEAGYPPKGPFKDKVQARFTAKQMTDAQS